MLQWYKKIISMKFSKFKNISFKNCHPTFSAPTTCDLRLHQPVTSSNACSLSFAERNVSKWPDFVDVLGGKSLGVKFLKKKKMKNYFFFEIFKVKMKPRTLLIFTTFYSGKNWKCPGLGQQNTKKFVRIDALWCFHLRNFSKI